MRFVPIKTDEQLDLHAIGNGAAFHTAARQERLPRRQESRPTAFRSGAST
jgi:hypothetical protein